MPTIESMAIKDIRIGERRRQDLGDIAALAKNIETHGLLHPVIIAGDNELIAGERRIRAHEHLGEDTILVRRWPDLSEEERREIELAENLNRKDLTAYERSRNMVSLAEVAAKVDQSEFRSESERNSKGGRPSEPGSLRRVAERTGVPMRTIHEAQQHVSAVEKYPALSSLPQSVALAVAKVLDALSEELRQAALDEIVSSPNPTETARRLAVVDLDTGEIIEPEEEENEPWDERPAPLSRKPESFEVKRKTPQDIARIAATNVRVVMERTRDDVHRALMALEDIDDGYIDPRTHEEWKRTAELIRGIACDIERRTTSDDVRAAYDQCSLS